MFRIDDSGKFRYNKTGDATVPANSKQEKVFTSSITQALQDRKSAGGSGKVDPLNEKVAVVEAGDAPERIARDNGISLNELQNANKGIFGPNDVLNPNDIIFIPQRDPVLTANSPKNADGVPADEQAFANDIHASGKELQDDKTLSPEQVNAGRLEIQKDVKTYLDNLPPADRQAAAKRLLGDGKTWKDATPASTAIKNAATDSFGDDIYTKGNKVEYADAPTYDHKGETGKITTDVKAYLEGVPQAERTARLQYLYDRDWQDAGPAKIAIEQAAKDMNIPLRESGHTGSEAEGTARGIIDKARAAGGPAEVKKTYTELSQSQPPEVQLALKRNPEAVQLMRDAENQQKVDKWLDGKDLESVDGVDTVMKALKGEEGDLGKLDDSTKRYLLDKVLAKMGSDDGLQNIGYLAEAAGRSNDSGLRSLVSERMAARAADLAVPESGKQPTPEDKFRARFFANSAVRAGTPYEHGDDGKYDMSSLRTAMEALGPEKAAAFVQSVGFTTEADSGQTTMDRTSSLQAILMAANSGDHTSTTSAVVQNVFALSDNYSPTLQSEAEGGPGPMAQALAREWFPDDAKSRDSEASRLQSILDTDQGKELLFPGTGDDVSLSLGARANALAIVRSDKSINRDTLEKTDDPWQNPVFINPPAQEIAGQYLHLRGNTPVVLKGTDLENTIGTAMGSKPVIPEGMSPEEVQEKIGKGELSLFGGEDNKPVQTIANQIRATAGGGDIAVTVLPIQYSSSKTGTVTLPLFRVSTSGGDKYVDNLGREYKDFNDWKANNQLPPGAMTYPTDGQLTENPDGSVKLSGPENTPKTVDTFGEHVTEVIDTAALVGGIIVGAAVIIGTGGVATPIVAGAGIAAAGWGAYRVGTQLVDRAEHGQSINPIEDADARMLWINGVASIAGAAAFGSAAKLTSLASKGATMTPTMARIIGPTIAFSNTADAVAIANMAQYSAANWGSMSGEEKASAILSMGFWGTTIGVNMSRGPSPTPRNIAGMFNPVTQTRNLLAAYEPTVVKNDQIPGNEVRIVDDPSGNGGFIIEAGPAASQADIANHTRVARLMYQNNGFQGNLRSFMGADVAKPGTKAYQIQFELEKLTPKLQQLRQDLQKPGLSDHDKAQISAEIGDHGSYLAKLQRAADDPNLTDLSTVKQASTGKAMANTDGPDGGLKGSSQEAFDNYCKTNGINAAEYVWYRQPGANGAPDKVALRRVDASKNMPELEVVAGRPPVVRPKPTIKPQTQAIGDAAEEHAVNEFKARGYTTILTAKNPSGHGVDIFMYNPTTRQYVVAEIKANTAQLSADQRLGPTYALDRMRRAADGEGSWASASQADKERASIALEKLTSGEPVGDTRYLVIRYDVDPATLAVSNPRHADWASPDGSGAPGGTADDTYGHLLELEGPPEFAETPVWQTGDGVP
ncbi:DUF4781 domain-containing protein [Phyllobacterium sp. YR531]|uniref:DUF4781 domain-containing protein n=1 Tax=Phyllobacterium sp. YR531 TaxID=1144343 RepID=UPI00026F9923|nr:DUF4781 domain-containing protein [Phyllobacterium sp. YR531]EJM99255.1 LysM domain-containing protein [Phyllobacterium sp. YR531]